MTKTALGVLLFCCVLLTAACESSEERAEEHFQDGVALLEAGDVDRALVEFRNVFRLNGRHKEARRMYAEAEIDRGNLRSGYSQYLRLVEQYPDDFEARRELTRLAMRQGNWDEVAKHSPHLIKADASDPVGRVADLGLRYRAAVQAEDTAAQEELAKEALALREELPDEPMIPELLADYYVRVGQREEALDEIARAIELSEDPRRLYMMRLSLLQEMGDLDALEDQLVEMAALFPDDPVIQATLIRWYLSHDKVDEAEAFLRGRTVEGGPTENVDLVRFLVEYRGREAAIAELDELLAKKTGDETLYRSLRAGLIFEAGRREEAIAELQAILDAAAEETDDTRNVKVALARMLAETGNSVGARALVEDVLASDPNHVTALKMRASWLIEDDEAEDAILALRTALEQSPRDPSLMTLMAQAYERAGNRALMAEMLSLAAEVSNSAPAETITYARYLLSDGKSDVAERALVDSLRLNPGNVDLLQLLGSIYVDQADWPRASQVADTLTGLDAEGASSAANSLRTQILAGQGRNDEVVGLLEQLIDSGEAGLGAQVAIVRTHLANGDTEDAMQYLDARLAETPEEPTLRFLKGSVLEVMGRTEEAEALFAELVEETPEAVVVWSALYQLQQRAGRTEDAHATLQRALEANPQAADLLWMKASALQQAGDLEGALDIYAKMYERDSSAAVIANNYASLLTALRDDKETIEKAYAVARRLQGLDIPAFQDTYGWIAYLRGEYKTALEYLEPAAEALADDPGAQYHVALAYEANDRIEEAKAALRRAIELAGNGASLPQLEEARQKLAELEAVGE